MAAPLYDQAASITHCSHCPPLHFVLVNPRWMCCVCKIATFSSLQSFLMAYVCAIPLTQSAAGFVREFNCKALTMGLEERLCVFRGVCGPVAVQTGLAMVWAPSHGKSKECRPCMRGRMAAYFEARLA